MVSLFWLSPQPCPIQMFLFSSNSRLLPLTSATLNPVINVNTDNETVPTGVAGAAGVTEAAGAAEAATTNSGEAVHKSSNCGDVVKVNVNNNTKRKPNNKNTDAVKNLPHSQVKNNNCETSGWI